ncbi:hypothetical protein ABGF26_02715 [Helcococcus ovis]|uniref:hypothetical protein n=1 Tax=Helcococcus ovis TaxID=72026 RepID=UPI0038B8D847
MKTKLKYKNGEFSIVLDKFFPTTKERIEELNKIIKMSENGKEVRDIIIKFLKSDEKHYKNLEILEI